jgi:hypothetical protein
MFFASTVWADSCGTLMNCSEYPSKTIGDVYFECTNSSSSGDGQVVTTYNIHSVNGVSGVQSCISMKP